MAASTVQVKACFFGPHSKPSKIEYMTIKEPEFTPCPASPTWPQLEALGRERLNTRMFYFEDINATEPRKVTARLPNLQPWYPEQWNPEAWRKCTVYGTDKFHIFKPSMRYVQTDSHFMLKVSRRQDGQLFYEDIGDLTPERTRELRQFVLDFDRALEREPTRWHQLRDLETGRYVEPEFDDGTNEVMDEIERAMAG